MRLKMLKEMFTAGALSSASIVPHHLGGWKLMVHYCNGDSVATSIANKDEHKIYVRLSAAIMDACRIGFEDVSIQVPKDYEPDDRPKSGLKS